MFRFIVAIVLHFYLDDKKAVGGPLCCACPKENQTWYRVSHIIFLTSGIASLYQMEISLSAWLLAMLKNIWICLQVFMSILG